MSKHVVVTLIHGTHAREASWTKGGSLLRKSVHDAFPDGVEFRRLKWSGDNTIRARHAAAGDLRAKILADHVPASKHFIIAHSHGGNIALYALRDPKVRKRITGVATLATPFLIARMRDLGDTGLDVFVGGFVGLSWLAAYLMGRFILRNAGFQPFIVVSLCISLIALLVRLQLRAQKVTEEDLQLAPPAEGRLWIARMTGDEASELLLTGQFAATIVARAYLFFGRAYKWAEKVGSGSLLTSIWLGAGGLTVTLSLWAVGKFFGMDERSDPLSWSFLTGIVIGLLIVLWGVALQVPRVVVPLAAGLVTLLAFGLPILLVLPFGRSVALYSVLLEMSAEATPLGKWTIHQYERVISAANVGDQDTPPLNHSCVYDHSAVLKDLTAWMKGCTALGAAE